MSDDDSSLQVRQAPRKRTGEAHVADFTMLVRVPGQPAAVRVYTDAEQDEGARYASEVGEWLCRCLFHRPPASPQVPVRP